MRSALGVAAGVVALVVAAGVANAAVDAGEVLRHTTVGGLDVGGLGRAELTEVLAGQAAAVAGRPLVIRTPAGEARTTLAELAVSVDVEATVEAALATSGGNLLVRPWRSLLSHLGHRTVAVRWEVDTDEAVRALRALPGVVREAPTEPGITWDGGTFHVRRGEPGEGVDLGAVLDRLATADLTAEPLSVEVGWSPIPPRFDEDDARALIGEAERLTASGIVASVNDVERRIDPPTLRSWLTSTATFSGLHLTIDAGKALAALEEMFADAATGGGPARFEVTGDGVRIVPSEPGWSCCDPAAPSRLLAALKAGEPGPVALPLRPTDPDGGVAEAEALGITEKVAEFTTRHACCEPRVTNIHRIADLLRGHVIRPGETFSLNGTIGRRTAANGFVEAGVIQNGIFKSDVGGGISQFATTLFNAAFFAGLEFPEYQSHSIYISRYPRGREATVSYPAPDLKIHNPTPYGVLIWTSYTDTSITVSLWSTRYFEVTQTGQRERPQGACTRVITERRRVTPDGEVLEDSVFAVYRPAEGIDCAGNPTETTTTTTTAPPETTTTAPPETTTTTTTAPPETTTTTSTTTTTTP